MRILEFAEVSDRVQPYKREIVAPDPGPDEVRFRVSAYAINRADILYMRGTHYSVASLPSRVGSEACGIVEAVGEGVSQIRVGDRVSTIPFDNSRYGVAGEFAVTPQSYLVPWPKDLEPEEACSVWMQYLTAYYPMREIYPLKAGKRVLVTAASSSAGLAGIQIARLLGAEVIAVTRSEKKAAALKAAGAHHVIVTSGDTLTDRIKALTNNEGVDLVYDPLGGNFVRHYAGALRQGARILIYGVMHGDTIEAPIMPIVRSAALVHPYSLFTHIGDPSQRERGVQWVLDAINNRGLRPVIGRVFSFEEALVAYDYMELGEHLGKIVVRI